VLEKDLHRYLNQAELSVTTEQEKQLLSFLNLLHKWNKAYNLTSVRSLDQMLVRHVMDSVVISPYLVGERFVDVGTGPGLPGIPLAILNPDKHFVLVDSLGKRIRFQTQVKTELGLKNIESIESRVENYQPEEKFDMVLSRAFAQLNDMLEWCQHLPNDMGHFLALKGKLDPVELASISSQFQVHSTHQLEVPELNEERHLIDVVMNYTN
jgi:16S rRNA (guanine527-N7)-methyltransferase